MFEELHESLTRTGVSPDARHRPDPRGVGAALLLSADQRPDDSVGAGDGPVGVGSGDTDGDGCGTVGVGVV